MNRLLTCGGYGVIRFRRVRASDFEVSQDLAGSPMRVRSNDSSFGARVSSEASYLSPSFLVLLAILVSSEDSLAFQKRNLLQTAGKLRFAGGKDGDVAGKSCRA